MRRGTPELLVATLVLLVLGTYVWYTQRVVADLRASLRERGVYIDYHPIVVTESQEGLGSGPTIQHPHVGAAPFIGNQRDALAIAIITGMGRRIETHREPPTRLEPEPKALVAG